MDDNEAIRQRAYEIWQSEGQLHGRDQDHWDQAHAELSAPIASATSGSRRPKRPSAARAEPVPARKTRPGRKAT